MQRFLTLFLFLCTFHFGFSQNSFWQDIDEQNIQLTPNSVREIIPTKYRTVQLEKSAIETFLAAAPKSNSLDADNPLLVELPMPDGGNESFEIVYDPVMPDGLASRYPSIRSYMGRNVNDRTKYVRFTVSPRGFNAIVRTREGIVFVSPYAANNVDQYISYYANDDPQNVTFSCGATNEMFKESVTASMPVDLADKPAIEMRSGSAIVERREYTSAVACVGEWGLSSGGTVELALARIVQAMDILNSYFETEHAIKFTLIENNDELVFIDPQTDPYGNVTLGAGLLEQNRTALNSIIGLQNYDIGHVFTIGCTDVGGIAGGGVCSNGKARGVTCFYNSNTNFIVSNVMAHEIAHQFSAGHTWNNCPGNEGQYASGSAYEPGSGTTIMSYAGACNVSNIGGGDDYYHVETIREVYSFSHESGGAECGEDIVNSNNYPVITDWNYVDGFYIPQSTPFELDANAEDIDGDPMTFNWEQYNLGPSSLLGFPTGNAPIFRSYPPNGTTKRVFPRLQKIIQNNYDDTEMLPTYGRDLNFKFIARDNRVDGGGVTHQEVAFHVADNAGPFLVSHPNIDTLWNAGEYTEVNWDVANSDLAPINCKYVNIKLSTDGGFTYPFVLVENTLNDGSTFITVPNVATSSARIRIEAADNIFFDISNNNFRIEPSTISGFATTVSPVYEELCLPVTSDVNFNTFGLNGYDSLLTVTIASVLPQNVVPTFTNNPAEPGTDIGLNLDLTNAVSIGNFDVDFIITGANADTAYRTISYETISNDFASVAPVTPASGASAIVGTPTFEWDGAVDAQLYDIEISTSPAFGPDDIVDSSYGTSNTFYDVQVLLGVNTIHYWRVRPSNICGVGEWSAISAFHTEALGCNISESDNVPVNIPFAGTPTIESTITVLSEGTISDLNVAKLRGNHDLIKHLDVTLISPAGTEVELFSDLCGNTTTFNFGLDDQAPIDIPCPPITQQVHIPQNPLSAFNGESTMGTWTLRMEVIDTDGNGGSLAEWSLDFCSNVALNPPFLVNNNPLVTPLSATSAVSKNLLLVEDANNTADDLLYTIVDVPVYGNLLFDGDVVVPGTQLTQGSINDFRLEYEQDGSNVAQDNFTFNVSDQEGGWVGILTFDIDIDPNATVNTIDLEDNNGITLYPNPSKNNFNILFDEVVTGKLNVTVLNVQGQEIISSNFDQGRETIEVQGTELPAGIYFVKVTTEDGIFTDKITIQK